MNLLGLNRSKSTKRNIRKTKQKRKVKDKKKKSYMVEIISSFIVLVIIFSFLGVTAIIFPGLFIFAIVFNIIIKLNFRKSFELAIINVIFNVLVQVVLISWYFSGLGNYIGLVNFFGGIIITKMFLDNQ
jgi:hypothetical protein